MRYVLSVMETDEGTIHQAGVGCHREGSACERNLGVPQVHRKDIPGLKEWVEVVRPQKTF